MTAVPFVDPMGQIKPLLGRLFFSNPNASAGQWVSLPVAPNELLDWLEDEGLGNHPVVTVYRNAKEMATRRGGAEDEAIYDKIRETEPEATIEEVERCISTLP